MLWEYVVWWPASNLANSLIVDATARYNQSQGSWDPATPYFLRTVYATEVLAAPASLTAKGSILLLYLRIFNPSVQLRQCVAATLVITGIFAIPSLPLFSFYCAPNATTTTWAPSIANTCASANLWAAVLQVADAMINLVIFLLPLPSIFRLHLSMKRRLLLAFVLMHGVFALAASIVGAVYRVQLAKTPVDRVTALWFRSAAFTAFGVELSMTLVTGSMHACWGYLRSAHARYQSSKGSRGTSYYYDSERHGASGGSGEKMAAASVQERGSVTPGSGGRNGFRPPLTPPLTGESPRRWGVAYTSYSRTQTTPVEDEELDLAGPTTAPTSNAVSAAQAEPASKYPRSPSDSEPSSLSRPLSFPGHASDLPSGTFHSDSTKLCEPHSARDIEPPRPRTHPAPRNRSGLMSDIEAAVSATGKARLVVGHARPSSGASFDAVDVRQSFDVPPRNMNSFYTSETGSPVPRTGSEQMSHHAREPQLRAASMEQRREYVVERVDGDYLVSRAPGQEAAPRHVEPWMGIRRDVHVEVRESM
jgi:hypothetical protein